MATSQIAAQEPQLYRHQHPPMPADGSLSSYIQYPQQHYLKAWHVKWIDTWLAAWLAAWLVAWLKSSTVGKTREHIKMKRNRRIYNYDHLATGGDTLHSGHVELAAVRGIPPSFIDVKRTRKGATKSMLKGAGWILRRLHLHNLPIAVLLLASSIMIDPASAASIPGPVGLRDLAPSFDKDPKPEDYVEIVLAYTTTIMGCILTALEEMFHQWFLGAGLATGLGSRFKQSNREFHREGRSRWFLWFLPFYLGFLFRFAYLDVHGGIESVFLVFGVLIAALLLSPDGSSSGSPDFADPVRTKDGCNGSPDFADLTEDGCSCNKESCPVCHGGRAPGGPPRRPTLRAGADLRRLEEGHTLSCESLFPNCESQETTPPIDGQHNDTLQSPNCAA